MNPIIKKVEEQHKEHLRILEKNDGETHFDRVMKREKEDPGVHVREHWNAVAMGQKNADNFMNKVTDPTRSGHGEALTAFADKYNGKRENVEKDHINKAVKLMDAPAQYLQNQAYENHVLSSFQIGNETDQAFLNKFKDYIKTKWAAQGYDGDVDFYKDFFSVHPMSTLPVKNFAEDGRIYPYVQKS